jgi:formate dehydrogenase subunit delta
MNIDLLIKMANEIGEFFAGASGDQAEATQAAAAHMRRYWEPRMRAQIIGYYEERSGAGLSDVALGAVRTLREASRSAASPSPPAPAAPSAPKSSGA